MGINWGQLTPINAPNVMVQLPVQPNPTDQLAGGIMQGLAQGQQMAQSAALFPGAKQLQQQQIQSNQINLQNAQDARAYALKLQQAAQINKEEYIKALNPADQVAFLKSEADLKKTLAESSSLNANANKTNFENYHSAIQSIGMIYNAASHGKSPEEKQRIYDYGKSHLPEQQQKLLPAQYNEIESNAALSVATEEQANYVLMNNKPTDKMKNAQRIADLQELKSSNQANQNQLNELKSLEEQTKPNNMGQLTPGQKVTVQATGNYLQQRNTTKVANTQNLTALNAMENISDKALSGPLASLDLNSRKLLNQLTGIPVDSKTSTTEVMNALAKQYQISQQMLMKGSSSDRDMELLAQTGPQITNTLPGRKLMFNQLRYRASIENQQIDFENAWAAKHDGSLEGAADAWSKFVNTRKDFDPKQNKFTSFPESKDWKPFLDENYSPPQSKSYMLNGKPFDMDAAKKVTGMSEEDIVKKAGLK